MNSLFEAGEFVRTVQRAQGLPIAVVRRSPTERVDQQEELLESARRYGKSPYGRHLQGIADGEIRLVDNSKPKTKPPPQQKATILSGKC